MKKSMNSLAVLLLPAVSGCEDNRNDAPLQDPVVIQLTLKQKGVVESANKFAFDLFVPIIDENKGNENIMISPFSVTSALSMTLNGAEWETTTGTIVVMGQVADPI